MAEYIGIRAVNRSANVRINKVKITSTATTLIDISDPTTKKEFGHHSSIGQIYVVSGLSTALIVTQYGLGVTPTETESKKIAVAAGELRNRSTGAVITVPTKELEITKTTTKPRIDNVVVKLADGVASIQEGTAATEPVAPTVEAGYVVIATLTLAKEKEKITAAGITSTRVYSS